MELVKMEEWRVEKYVTVDRQGRIVIPKQVREKLKLTEGLQLKLIATSDGEKVLTLRKCA